MVTSLPGYLATIHKAQPDEKKNLSSARLLGWNFLFLMSAQPHLEKAARWEHLGTNTKTCSEKKKESLNSSLRIAFFFTVAFMDWQSNNKHIPDCPRYTGVFSGAREKGNSTDVFWSCVQPNIRYRHQAFFRLQANQISCSQIRYIHSVFLQVIRLDLCVRTSPTSIGCSGNNVGVSNSTGEADFQQENGDPSTRPWNNVTVKSWCRTPLHTILSCTHSAQPLWCTSVSLDFMSLCVVLRVPFEIWFWAPRLN